MYEFLLSWSKEGLHFLLLICLLLYKILVVRHHMLNFFFKYTPKIFQNIILELYPDNFQ